MISFGRNNRVKTKRIVDERELMEMYKIEHYTFWAMYGLLFVSIFVQLIFCGISFTQIAGEWIVFMIATIGSCYAFLKGGHYDYFLKPCMKSYLIYSLVGATLSDILYSFIIYLQLNYHNTTGFILSVVIIWVLMFAILFVALYIHGESVKKKRKELERQAEEDNDYIMKEERSKIVKKSHKVFLCFIFIITIINCILVININKQHGYYIGKIESIENKDGITTVEVSPIHSNRYFASEIKANHKIEYADDIRISGLRDRNKERKELYLGQLGEAIENLKVGDSIIFKAKSYDKNDYKLEIDELAVDLTIE